MLLNVWLSCLLATADDDVTVVASSGLGDGDGDGSSSDELVSLLMLS